jgi:hypothetical protein
MYRVKKRKDSSTSSDGKGDIDDIEEKLQKKDPSGSKDLNKQTLELNHETSNLDSLCNDKTVYIEGMHTCIYMNYIHI